MKIKIRDKIRTKNNSNRRRRRKEIKRAKTAEVAPRRGGRAARHPALKQRIEGDPENLRRFLSTS